MNEQLMVTLRVCLLAWVVSARTAAFHILGTWREGRVCGLAPSVGTLQLFGNGQQQRIAGDPTEAAAAALRPPSRVDRAVSLLKSLHPSQDDKTLIEKAAAAVRERVDAQMKTIDVAFTELEEKYLNSKATSSFLERMGDVYEMGIPQVMKIWKNAHEAVIPGILAPSPFIQLAYAGSSAAIACRYTARATAPFVTSATNSTTSLKLDSQHDVASKQQRESSVTLKANESNENELEGKTQHIVDLQRPSAVENVISGLQKKAVNSYQELDSIAVRSNEVENSMNRMMTSATSAKVEKDLDRILESCHQQPSRLPSDKKKELQSAIRKLKDLGSNSQMKKIHAAAHVGVWSLVYVNKERALKHALGGLLARLTRIRGPVVQIVEPNGTLVNEAQVQLRFMPFLHWLVKQRCTVKEEGESTVVIHHRRGFGIGPFNIFGKVRKAEMNLSYVGSRWKICEVGSYELAFVKLI